MPRFKLNSMVPGNYSFHCPEARITLNVYRPMSEFKEVTPSVVRGVMTNRLIDLDQVVEAKHHHIGLSDTDLKEVLLHGVQESNEKEDNKEMQEEINSNPKPEEVGTDVKEEAEEPTVEESTTEESVEAVALMEEPAEEVAPAPKKRTRSAKK